MKCEAVRNRILALADPRDVPGAFREHLDGCESCTNWWHGVVRVEALVAHLPIPRAPADKKRALIEQVRAAGPGLRPKPSPRPEPRFTRRTITYLAGLAASVALVVGVWALLRGPGQKSPVVRAPKHPLLEIVVQRNVALSKANTPAERLAALGGLADDVRNEARDLARVASPDELKALAGWYDKLVRDGLVSQAEKMPPLAMNPAAKAVLLRDLANRLTEAGDDSERLAKEAPPGAQESLRRIAESAREGQQKLRRLAAGGV